MRRSTLSLLAASVLLVGLAFALEPVGRPAVGDETTYLLATESLWHDGDLRYDQGDLDRAYRQWPGGPQGLALTPAAAGETPAFARPLLYPVLAAPFYGLLGPRGLPVLDMLVFLAMVWTAGLRSRPSAPRPAERRRHAGSWLLVAGFFFASAAFAWAFRLQPEVLVMGCGFFALALWCRVRSHAIWRWRELVPLAAAGALVAAAASNRPSLALLALPVAIDLAWARRLKGAAVFLAALLAAGFLLAGAQRHLTGAWAPALERSAASGAGEAAPAEAAEAAAAPGAEAGARLAATALLRDTGYFLAGRHVGLLPYFPFAFYVVFLYLSDLRGPGGRSRHLLAAALAVYCALVILDLPAAAVPGAAGPAAPGDRAFALVYPALLFLPRRLRAGRPVLLWFAAAGLWTAPALLASIGGAGTDSILEHHARGATFRPLPVELTLLADGHLPGYAQDDRRLARDGETWLLPRESFFLAEPNPEGVWVRGASRSELFIASPRPLDTIRLEVGSVAADDVLTLRGARGTVRVRFDSAAKRRGTPVDLRPEPLGEARGLFLAGGATAYLYRVTVHVSGGAVPALLDPASSDSRYLGVFLRRR